MCRRGLSAWRLTVEEIKMLYVCEYWGTSPTARVHARWTGMKRWKLLTFAGDALSRCLFLEPSEGWLIFNTKIKKRNNSCLILDIFVTSLYWEYNRQVAAVIANSWTQVFFNSKVWWPLLVSYVTSFLCNSNISCAKFILPTKKRKKNKTKI